MVRVAVFVVVPRGRGQREHEWRDVFDVVRYVARSGSAWRMIPGDLPPWAAVYQQFRRRLDAGMFKALMADVQSIAREWAGRKGQPSAICIDSRTLQSTPRERSACRPRRGQAAQGIEGSHRGQYAGPPAGPDGHVGRSGRSRSGGTASRTGSAGHGQDRGVGLRRPGLDRAERSRSATTARHTA